MRKLQLFIIVNICIILNTKCFSQTEVVNETKEVNYIPYLIEVQKAKRLSNDGKLKQAYKKLDSLFNFYEPKETLMIYEGKLYCELSDTLKIYNKKRLREIIISLAGEYDRDITKYSDYKKKWKRIFSIAGVKEAEVKKLCAELEANINTAIRDSIGVMYERDQWARATQERIDTKLDSVDKLNEPLLIDIITKYGYPKAKLVGRKNIDNPARDQNLSVLLKHVDPTVKINVLQPLLYQELKKGDLDPWVYASMLDHIRMVSQVESPFPYYGTYITNKSIQTIENLDEINRNRRSIGLLDLKK